MMTNTQPEWLIKLQDIWSRKDTAGFYELEELFKEYIKHEEVYRKYRYRRTQQHKRWRARKRLIYEK